MQIMILSGVFVLLPRVRNLTRGNVFFFFSIFFFTNITAEEIYLRFYIYVILFSYWLFLVLFVSRRLTLTEDSIRNNNNEKIILMLLKKKKYI